MAQTGSVLIVSYGVFTNAVLGKAPSGKQQQQQQLQQQQVQQQDQEEEEEEEEAAVGADAEEGAEAGTQVGAIQR
jgi:hypothetical protein